MRRLDAIKIAVNSLGEDDIALFTTGMIGREAFHRQDRRLNFYMLGSMGLVSSVGLGIALNTEKKVFIFDGDGSVLMDMGTMAMIGSEAPANLYHLVLDNEAYQSTGSQPAISGKIDLSEIAGAVGYKKVVKVEGADQLTEQLKVTHGADGPFFMLIKVEKEGLEEIPRVAHTPEHLTQRLSEEIR